MEGRMDVVTCQGHMSCWSSRLNSHLCWAQRLQAVMMSPLQPPLSRRIRSRAPNHPLRRPCSRSCLPPPLTPPLFQAVHAVPQCRVSSTTAEMAQHPPPLPSRPYAPPEGEANRSTSWVAASPLSAPHLGADPCPASGGWDPDTALFPLLHPAAHSLRVGEGEGNQTRRMRRQRWPRQGRSSKPMWWWGVGAFWRWTRGYAELGSQTPQAKKKKKEEEAFAWRNTGHCLLLVCFYFVFSGRGKVKCEFLIGLIKTAPSETLDAAVCQCLPCRFFVLEMKYAQRILIDCKVSFHFNSQGRH